LRLIIILNPKPMFLADTDYTSQVKDDILSKITEATATIRTNAERMAEAEMTGYLAVRYDATAVFAKTGTERNPQIIMLYIDIVLYHLHSRINPGQVPQLRVDRYNEAKRWLEMVAAGSLKPDLDEITDEDGDGVSDGNVILSGSSTPRNPYY
jgi:phage gp36-like protein